MNQRGASYWKQVLTFLMVVSALVNNAHWESTAYAHTQSTSAALSIHNPHSLTGTLIICNILPQISCSENHNDIGCTVPSSSLYRTYHLTNLDHNPSHVHSMYIIPQNHTPDNNVLMANILYSSLFTIQLEF